MVQLSALLVTKMALLLLVIPTPHGRIELQLTVGTAQNGMGPVGMAASYE